MPTEIDQWRCKGCGKPVLPGHAYRLHLDMVQHISCTEPEAKNERGHTIKFSPQSEGGARWDGVVMKDD